MGPSRQPLTQRLVPSLSLMLAVSKVANPLDRRKRARPAATTPPAGSVAVRHAAPRAESVATTRSACVARRAASAVGSRCVVLQRSCALRLPRLTATAVRNAAAASSSEPPRGRPDRGGNYGRPQSTGILRIKHLLALSTSPGFERLLVEWCCLMREKRR